HLPERRFAWEPIDRVLPPRPRLLPDRPLVRRIFATPLPLPSGLPPRRRDATDGWAIAGLERGPVVRLAGPYPVSTLWWTDAPVSREYVFAETANGELLWIFDE